MLKRYKNASVLKCFNENFVLNGDIVTDGDHICCIDKNQGGVETSIDLTGKTIIPSFKNYCCNLFGLNEREIEKKIDENIKSGVTDIVVLSDKFDFCKNLLEKKHLDYKIALPFEAIKKLECDEKHMMIYVDPLLEEENVLDEISDYAAKKNLKLLIKLFDNLDLTGKLNSSKNMLPTSYIESFGLLDRGGTILGSIWSDKEDYAILSSYGFDITVRPIADLRKGNGFANLVQIQNAGLGISIGTDDEDDIDVFREGRAILLGTRGMLNDPEVISEEKVLYILTKEGKIGEGEKASFIVLDRERLSPKEILNSLCKNDIYMVISNGEIIYKKGETR